MKAYRFLLLSDMSRPMFYHDSETDYAFDDFDSIEEAESALDEETRYDCSKEGNELILVQIYY